MIRKRQYLKLCRHYAKKHNIDRLIDTVDILLRKINSR